MSAFTKGSQTQSTNYLIDDAESWGSSSCHIMKIKRLRYVTNKKKKSNLPAPVAAMLPNPDTAMNRENTAARAILCLMIRFSAAR